MKIHIDLDAFFVSAERTRDATLQSKPVAVGGRGDRYIFERQSGHQQCNLENHGAFLGAFFQSYDPAERDIEKFTDPDGRLRGIVTTASYEARTFGITTGMSLAEARLRCPHLIIKAPDMGLYKELSHRLHDFLCHRIPLIEQASIDEFYGDLSGWVEDAEVPWFSDMLRHEIKRHFNLPVSIGAAHSKSIAKLATEFAKPFGCKTIFKEDLAAFLEPVPIEKFPGIGRAMRKRLEAYRIHTLGELLRARGIVTAWGPYAKTLYALVSGSDTGTVNPLHVRKSIGISRTFDPEKDRTELRRRVIILSRHLAYAIMRLGALPTTYYLGIRYEYNKKASYSVTEHRLFNESWFRNLALSLFYQADRDRHLKVIRLSLHASHFTCNSRRELSLLEFDSDSNARRLSQQIHQVRERYGLDTLRWGSEMA